MMKRLLLFSTLLMLLVGSYAQQSKPVNPEQATLITINHQFIRNFLNNDTIEHTKIIHRDFLFIGKDGRLHDRKEYMNAWAHGYDKAIIPEFTLEEEQIRIFGDVALIVARTKDKTMRNGKWINGETRYTDTYIKENGQWKCVQVQLTEMPVLQD